MSAPYTYQHALCLADTSPKLSFPFALLPLFGTRSDAHGKVSLRATVCSSSTMLCFHPSIGSDDCAKVVALSVVMCRRMAAFKRCRAEIESSQPLWRESIQGASSRRSTHSPSYSRGHSLMPVFAGGELSTQSSFPPFFDLRLGQARARDP